MGNSVLVVEDDVQVAKSLSDFLSRDFKVSVAYTAESALEILSENDFDLVLCDLKLPGMSGLDLLRKVKSLGINIPFVVLTAFGDIPTAVEAMKLGAVDFIRKGETSPDELITRIRDIIEDKYEFEFIAGSEVMKNLAALARKIAKTDSTVLIMGESGVGKEVLARYIHKYSPRAHKPFLAVNMSAIPDTLLEAELFGYEKGAFTGAEKRKLGKFELASGGTILLDEIGDMPLHLQPKILRVIQEKKLERLGQGSVNSVSVDVRVISTTNKDLENLVKEGKFREDLYYRLSVIPIKIPPLRERKEDIPYLTDYFFKKLGRKYGVEIVWDKDFLSKLFEYDWPGNVRELYNVLERAFILSWSGQKNVKVLPENIIFSTSDLISALGKSNGFEPILESKDNHLIKKDLQGSSSSVSSSGGENRVLDDKNEFNSKVGRMGDQNLGFSANFSDLNIRSMEKVFILEALARTGGNKTKAAQLLGITVRTLRNKLKELNIQKGENEPEEG
jgi:DNA-binding NtrC family response regulator